jgi:hypothetical protein
MSSSPESYGQPSPQVRRVVLHGIELQSDGLAFDEASRPVLDEAVEMVRDGQPATVVAPASATSLVRAYLAQHGVAGERVVVLAEPAGCTQLALHAPDPGCAGGTVR